MRRWIVLCLCLVSSGAAAQTETLRVESDPPGADIVVDDNRVLYAQTPADIRVSPGEHRVRLSLSGYAVYQETVTVVAGERAVLRAQLAARSGQLSFPDLPAGSVVRVGGEPFDPARRLPVGDVDIAVTTPDGTTLRTRTLVSSDRETAVAYDARQFRRRRALEALAVPGLVQSRDGQTLQGRLFGGAVFGGLAAAGLLTLRAQVAVGDTAAAQALYGLATSEPEAVAAREALEGRVGAIRSSRQARGAVLVGVGVAYVASLIDAFAGHVRVPALVPRIQNAASYGVRVSPAGASLAIRF